MNHYDPWKYVQKDILTKKAKQFVHSNYTDLKICEDVDKDRRRRWSDESSFILGSQDCSPVYSRLKIQEQKGPLTLSDAVMSLPSPISPSCRVPGGDIPPRPPRWALRTPTAQPWAPSGPCRCALLCPAGPPLPRGPSSTLCWRAARQGQPQPLLSAPQVWSGPLPQASPLLAHPTLGTWGSLSPRGDGTP